MKISKLIASLTLALCGAAHAWDYGPLTPRTENMERQSLPQTAMLCTIYTRAATLTAIRRKNRGEDDRITINTRAWVHTAWMEVLAVHIGRWTDEQKMNLFSTMMAAAKVMPLDFVNEQTEWCTANGLQLIQRISNARGSELTKETDRTLTELHRIAASDK